MEHDANETDVILASVSSTLNGNYASNIGKVRVATYLPQEEDPQS
jgi:hypothetical protein